MNRPLWTLPQALERAAATTAGLHFIQDDGSETFQSYATLHQHAGAIARFLSDHGIGPSHRVALLIPDAEGFFVTMFGVSMAGAAAVPLAPPLSIAQLGASLDNWKRMVRTAEVSAIITSNQLRPILGTLQAAVPSVRGVWTWSDLVREPGDFRADVSLDDPALIQFTSGSTSHPKGVVLTHQNLSANVNAITGPSGLGVTTDDVAVSWLPLFHDMGLIGIVIGVVSVPTNAVLMPPLLFLKRPVEWLRAITRHRGTISYAPNFAYELCARRAGDKLQGLDLSSWRVAGCGAEPIRPTTLLHFSTTFAPAGFRETSIVPSYGLAEHTLAVTFHALSEPMHVDCVRSDVLQTEGRVVTCDEANPSASTFVSCGKPFPGHEVRIVGDHDRVLGERHVGEIQVRGPSVMKEYFRDTTRSTRALRDGWLRTGDLGYLSKGELYPCGRKKDMIIVHGRNYYPQDLEWAASEVEGVRKGNVAAFGISAPDGSEQVVIAAESRVDPAATDLAARISRHVQDISGLHVHQVVIVPRGSVAKTTSGKVQRAKVKALYETGELGQRKGWSRGLVGHIVSSRVGYAVAAFRQCIDRVCAAGDEREQIEI